METQEIYKILDDELDYQLEKWGEEGQNHEIASYILYMEHHLENAKKLASTNSPETPALEELRKVVTLGVNCFKKHGIIKRFRSR